MPLITVLRNVVHLKSIRSYERCVERVAKKARSDKETFQWGARAENGSEGPVISYISTVENFAELAARENPDAMIRRLFGEKEGEAILEELGEGTQSSSSRVLQQNDDLSRPAPQADQPVPLIFVTRLSVRPGGQAACEELIRRVVEAASKVDKERYSITLQTLVGNLMEYVIVQPLADPGQLDRQRRVPELLAEAFGAREGERIFQTGREAIQEARSELSVHRPELSNQR